MGAASGALAVTVAGVAQVTAADTGDAAASNPPDAMMPIAAKTPARLFEPFSTLHSSREKKRSENRNGFTSRFISIKVGAFPVQEKAKRQRYSRL
ncbi:hypothetical protein [Streptomyces sp. NPDC001020]